MRLGLCALLLAGCSDASGSGLDYVPDEGTAEHVAWSVGATRYLGIEPSAESTSDTVTSYEFDPADGPICMRGAPFRVTVDDRPDSEDLLVFLQGGGACWSEFCLAVTTAPPRIPRMDLLRGDERNPLAGWDIVYVPYCDGSLFAGDAEVDEDGDGAPDRLHHGLHNLSAALTVAHARFRRPRRVVLAGSSGGGFGTILAAYLVRYVYPGVPIDVLNDAGVGVARPGDDAFVDGLIDEFGARGLIPADCADCVAGGHITGLVGYQLARDPLLRVAAISSWYDFVISDVFLDVPPEAFRDALDVETAALRDAHPGRYHRFLYEGAGHTALLGDVTGITGSDLGSVEVPMELFENLGSIVIESMYEVSVDEVLLADWIGRMVGDGDWADLTAPPGPPPAREPPPAP